MALQKLQCFFKKVMCPYPFFDGSGPKFFCRVNGLKKNTGPYQFRHLLLNNLIKRMRTKNPRSSGVKSAVDFNMAAGENSQEKDSCSAWKDEEVESLIDIFSEETIRRHFVLEELRMPGSNIQLHQLP